MHIFRSLFSVLLFVFSPWLWAQTQITTVPAADNISYNLENSLVSAYLKDAGVAYKDGIGRSGTSILNYKVLGSTKAYYLSKVENKSDFSPNWAEQPQPVSINTKQKGTILVSRTPTFTKDTTSFAAVVGTTKLYNLLPQTVYWYKVKNASGVIVSTGIFKTQGKLRMLYSPKALNVRDIGGWPCTNGRIAYGKIIRGTTLDGNFSSSVKGVAIGEADKDFLVRISGVTHDFDLRGETSTISPLGSKVARVNYSFNHYMYQLTNTSYSSSKKTISSGKYYTYLNSAIKKLYSVLSAGGCVYTHCSFGADRAGTFIATIEAMLGVSEADIVKDWELTSFMSFCYFKMIDQSEIKYYYQSGSSVVESTAELREFFKHLYDNYGGKTGATLQQQVIAWLKAKVLTTSTDQAYITKLQSLLVTPAVKSPTIVKACGDTSVGLRYSVTTESTALYTAVEDKLATVSTGTVSSNENCCMTDYISCSTYKYLLVNEKLKNAAVFYDANKKFISGVGESTLDASSVVYDSNCVQYSIPSTAAYVRFNMPKYSPWTAVMSYQTLK